MRKLSRGQAKGIQAAVLSALFMGLTPVFGKLAISLGLPPMAVAGLRTIFATALLFLFVLIYNRSFLYIYPAGLLGCMLAGGINGLGSLLFYTAIGRIGASLGQMIYSLYPLFVALWLWLDHQPPSRVTLMRLALLPPALVLLTWSPTSRIDLIGVALMLGASALYALHLPINQRVLYDMPAPTVTLYTLMAMSIVVTPALIFTGVGNSPKSGAWGYLIGLTVVTLLARLTLFMGVKSLGGLQTALIGLVELLVTLVSSFFLIGERLTIPQWVGALLLILTIMLVRADDIPIRRAKVGGWLSWLRPPGIPKDMPW